MTDTIKIGILREEKTPADARVPLSPQQCRLLLDTYPQVQLAVAPSPHRCFSDADFEALHIPMQQDLSDCDILLGVKEVPPSCIVADKTYLFFSHTIKKQAHNQKLLRQALDQKIRLIDYECLRRPDGKRIIGFGRYAGIVGAHNGLQALAKKLNLYDIPSAYSYQNFEAIKADYANYRFPAVKIVNTGNGKVPNGSRETLLAAGIREVSPEAFLTQQFDEAVFVHLHYENMYKHRRTHTYDKQDFYKHPHDYYCDFAPYTEVADLFINGIFWLPEGPVYFSKEEMRRPDFRIRVIADITCDIAPQSSVPSTLRATCIGDPIFGYDPYWEKEVAPYQPHTIEVMSIDNLPNELPQDASEEFGRKILEVVLPELLLPHSDIIERATLCKQGKLGTYYTYLQDYADGLLVAAV